MGYAYLEDSGETRNSPSTSLVNQLVDRQAELIIHDPNIPEYQGSVLEMAHNCDVAVLMVRHQQYRSLDLSVLKQVLRSAILVDGRNFFGEERATQADLDYWALGIAKIRG